MQPTVIVTGASRGLGAAAARHLARLGASLVLSARSASPLAELAAAIEAAGGQATALAGDVSQPELCERLVAQAIAQSGRLDAILNNAGVLEPIATIAESDIAAWRRNLETNVIGPYLLTRAALPHLRQAPAGRVINVSSGAAARATVGWSAYCVSKAALNHFTAVLATEEPGITAISVRPGMVDTEMQGVIRAQGQAGMQAEEHANFVRLHRQRQLLSPERPALALAVLALSAPKSWSGDLLSWDDPRVAELVRTA